MSVPTRALLVEPNLVASRLHVLVSTVRALQASGVREIEVVTGAGTPSRHFLEMTGELSDVRLRPVQGLDAYTMQQRVPVDQWRRLCGEAAAVLDAWPPGALVVLMALDDALRPALVTAGALRRATRRHRLLALKYRVDMLLPGRRTAREHAIAAVVRGVLRRSGAELVVVDDRFAGRRVGGSAVHVLPDPWEGPFSPTRRASARRALGVEGEHVALAVGRQVRRKGFDTVLEAVPALAGAGVTLLVVGAVDPAFEQRLRAVRAQTSGIRHVDRFVSDEELLDVFACADVVLLPYDRSFHSSSGVLPRAAASGVPVVASAHGLIGHHVRTWGLGETIPAGGAGALVAAVERVRSRGPEAYAQALQAFAARSSQAGLTAAWGRLLTPDAPPPQDRAAGAAAASRRTSS